MQPPVTTDSDAPSTVLQPGNRVKVNTPGLLDLIFTIDCLTQEAGQPMACGTYGCFATHLLIKLA